MSRFSTETLIAYLLHEADQEIAASIERERAESPELQKRLDALQGFVGVLPSFHETRTQFEVGRDLLEKLKSLGDQAPATARAPWDRVGDLILSLVADLRPGVVAASGFRGAASDARLMTFASGDIDVELRVTPVASLAGGPVRSVSVIGRSSSLSRCEIELSRDSSPTIRTSSDDHGYFEMQAQPGEYRMTISVGGGRVVLDSVDLRM